MWAPSVARRGAPSTDFDDPSCSKFKEVVALSLQMKWNVNVSENFCHKFGFLRSGTLVNTFWGRAVFIPGILWGILPPKQYFPKGRGSSLMKQEMMGWQWHKLNHMQIICTSFQTDNHASLTSPLMFSQAGCSSWRRTNSVKALKAMSSQSLRSPSTSSWVEWTLRPETAFVHPRSRLL